MQWPSAPKNPQLRIWARPTLLYQNLLFTTELHVSGRGGAADWHIRFFLPCNLQRLKRRHTCWSSIPRL